MGLQHFPFENVNGHLKALFHGTKDMSKQVMVLFSDCVLFYVDTYPPAHA